MGKIYTLYGSGGYAREVMPLLRDKVNLTNRETTNEFYFIDDSIDQPHNLNGAKVLSFNDLLKKFINHKIYSCIAIANKKDRKKLTKKCADNGINMFSIISSNSVIMDNVDIGIGSIISPFVTITSNVSIGKSFQANIYSYVAHDCQIGNFVTLAPSVKCNGNVIIKDGAYIGTAAIIYPGTKNKPITIGQNSKIAAGAVVRKDVPDNVTVVGNPAQILNRDLLKKMKSENE